LQDEQINMRPRWPAWRAW